MGERRFKEIGKRKRKFLALLTVFMLVVGALGVNAVDKPGKAWVEDAEIHAGTDGITADETTFTIKYFDTQGNELKTVAVPNGDTHTVEELDGKYNGDNTTYGTIKDWRYSKSYDSGKGTITLTPYKDTTYFIFQDDDGEVLESYVFTEGHGEAKYPAYSKGTPTKGSKKFIKWTIQNQTPVPVEYSAGGLIDEILMKKVIICQAVYEDAPDPGKGSYSVSGTVQWRKGSSKPAEAIIEGTGADGQDSWLHFTQDGNVTGRVSIDGQELTYGSDWNAHQGNSTHIEIAAEVLEQYKANSTHTIKVTFDDGEADVTLKILSGDLRYLDDGIHYDDDSSDPEPTNPVAPATGKITPKTGEV